MARHLILRKIRHSHREDVTTTFNIVDTVEEEDETQLHERVDAALQVHGQRTLVLVKEVPFEVSLEVKSAPRRIMNRGKRTVGPQHTRVKS